MGQHMGQGVDQCAETGLGSQPAPIARLWALAAHDLRQPVQAALLLTKMLEAEPSRAEQRSAAERVGAALESIGEMLEILALLSRIEAGLQVVPLRMCQLPEVLEPTLQAMAETATRRGITLRRGRMQGRVRSNPQLLGVATKSLFLNAIKFGAVDGILTRCRRQGDRLRLEVQFGGAALDGGSARNAFVQLPPSAERSVADELGLGVSLLEHLCLRLGHTLHCASLPRGIQLLAIDMPTATAAS